MVAEERWEALEDYIGQLPTASRFHEAYMNDPEIAEMLAGQEASEQKWHPRLSEFDLHATLQREILEVMKGVRSAIVVGNGGRPGTNKPFPGPVTEVDRVRKRQDDQFLEDIMTLAGFDPELDL